MIIAEVKSIFSLLMYKIVAISVTANWMVGILLKIELAFDKIKWYIIDRRYIRGDKI